MIVKVGIIFDVKLEFLQDVINIFKDKNVSLPTPDTSLSDREVTIRVIVPFDEKVNYYTIIEIYQYLETHLQVKDIAERYYFEFSNEEYAKAPFFILQSPGNSQSAFLKDKGTDYKNEIYCENCGLIIQHQQSPLVIDTSIIKSRYLVNVGAHWVVSEKMAALMYNWGLSGYELKEVLHKGPEKGKQPAYQIVPTATFPKWSQEMKPYYFYTEKDRICKSCGIKGLINGAYLYNREDLLDLNNDIYVTHEFSHDWKYVYSPTILSKKFRDLIIEHKITKDIRGIDDPRYGSKDWLLDPIIVL